MCLYAFNDGILGEFSKADISHRSGKDDKTRHADWVPVRYGHQIWQIGVPDRSAAEFRHGDHYWQWGLYNLVPAGVPERGQLRRWEE